jgi:hypothetical protein
MEQPATPAFEAGHFKGEMRPGFGLKMMDSLPSKSLLN